MARVSIERLCKQFTGAPPTNAADHLDLQIEDGEFLVLLGPSGCGKTTTLRCLAGLEAPDSGRIRFGERRVFDAAAGIDIAPDKRNIGMVFQSYALWPHMTVRRNIEYPLIVKKLKHGLREGWVDEMVKLVDCEKLLDRYPGQLSGGQQQRVSLARGLVARPDLLLLDEPLSNLDALLRDQVRSQLHELHGRLGFTAVFVTHDQGEALALADRLAIMRSGRIEQLDTARNVFECPTTEYVANFIGMNNRFVLECRDGIWMCAGVVAAGPAPDVQGDHRQIAARVRSEDLAVGPPGQGIDADSIGLHATVVDATFAGRHFDVVVAIGAERFQGRAASGASDADRFHPGAPVTVSFRRGSAVCYAMDGRRIGGRVSVGDPDRTPAAAA